MSPVPPIRQQVTVAADPSTAFAVFTDGLGPQFRPNADPFMTAEITMETVEGGTRYRALVRHKTSEDRARHEARGFHQGWGTCLTQLDDLAVQL